MPVGELVKKLQAWSVRKQAIEYGRESLVVPWFPGEFNRCVLHRPLNQHIQGKRHLAPRWCSFSPMCRVRDTGKLTTGWHLTLFEGFALGDADPASSAVEMRKWACESTVEILSRIGGLEQERIEVTYFGGGEVLPGICLGADQEWRRAWEESGIVPSNLKAVPGMKNFLLFVGPGERCGPKCEIMVRLPGSKRSLEVGTAIMDEWVLAKASSSADWSVEPSTTPVSGVAFGLERMASLADGVSTVWDTPELRGLVDLVASAVGTRIKASELLEDIRIVVDQVRALWFVLHDVHGALSDAQNGWLEAMSRRTRRRLEWLQIDDWPTLVDQLEESLRSTLGRRHSGLLLQENVVRPVLETLRWPESWNPESYLPEG